MKISVCLIGDMSSRNRNWDRTKINIKSNLISCWGQNNEVDVFICSEHVPDNIIDFYQPKKIIIQESHVKDKYVSLISEILDEKTDFIIFTRPDIVFLKNVSSFNIKYDKFNFLFREVNHWSQTHKYTCDNFFATSKQHLIYFYKTLLNCEKVKPFSGELHSQIYPCLVDYISDKNIHFIDKSTAFSSNGESLNNAVPGYLALNDYYLLDRYYNIPGDLGPTTVEDFKKWYDENPDKIEYLRNQIENSNKYIDDHL